MKKLIFTTGLAIIFCACSLFEDPKGICVHNKIRYSGTGEHQDCYCDEYGDGYACNNYSYGCENGSYLTAEFCENDHPNITETYKEDNCEGGYVIKKSKFYEDGNCSDYGWGETCTIQYGSIMDCYSESFLSEELCLAEADRLNALEDGNSYLGVFRENENCSELCIKVEYYNYDVCTAHN